MRSASQQSANTLVRRIGQQPTDIDARHARLVRRAKGEIDIPTKRMRALIVQRIAEGATQEQIAENLDQHQSWVSQVKNGTIESIGAAAVFNACRALHIDANFFFDEKLADAPDYTKHMRGIPYRRGGLPTTLAADRTLTDADVDAIAAVVRPEPPSRIRRR